ncbi:hypothetical protein [uncultured Phocaeicola sp.]|uniref:hypothetical protein n=1 Tax=uncultured Phocaeicola sp. TaxID=990718 RepID=UPI00143404B8|nr:hypothetical protein [uncultured Phocaeicola sp.]GFH98042.1 hypothetical protein IMSAGC004_00428 [Bacteroidaceae bacterium]
MRKELLQLLCFVALSFSATAQNKEYHVSAHSGNNPFPGPFEIKKAGEYEWKVWANTVVGKKNW